MNQPEIVNKVWVNGEEVTVEDVVEWADEERRTLRVRATAYGPSTWMTERSEESCVIGPAQGTRE